MIEDEIRVDDLRIRYGLCSNPYYNRDGLLEEFLSRALPPFEAASELQGFYVAADRAFSAWCVLFHDTRQSRSSVDKQWAYVYARFLAPYKAKLLDRLTAVQAQ